MKLAQKKRNLRSLDVVNPKKLKSQSKRKLKRVDVANPSRMRKNLRNLVAAHQKRKSSLKILLLNPIHPNKKMDTLLLLMKKPVVMKSS